MNLLEELQGFLYLDLLILEWEHHEDKMTSLSHLQIPLKTFFLVFSAFRITEAVILFEKIELDLSFKLHLL